MRALSGSVRGRRYRGGHRHIGIAKERKSTKSSARIDHAIEGDGGLVTAVGILTPLTCGDPVFAQDVGAVVGQLLDLWCRNLSESAGRRPGTPRIRQHVVSSQLRSGRSPKA